MRGDDGPLAFDEDSVGCGMLDGMASTRDAVGELSGVRRRLASFTAAFRGLAVLGREVHSRVHLLATCVAIGLGWRLGVSAIEWCVLVLTIGLVWMGEALNTALERLADAAVPQRHPLVGAAKDVAAAAVLLGALASCVVAAIIFGGHLLG